MRRIADGLNARYGSGHAGSDLPVSGLPQTLPPNFRLSDRLNRWIVRKRILEVCRLGILHLGPFEITRAMTLQTVG